MSGWPRPPTATDPRSPKGIPTARDSNSILCKIFGICPDPDPNSDDPSPDGGNGSGNGSPPMGDFPVPDPGGPLPA